MGLVADRDIPEEMVEKAAHELFAGPHHRFKMVGEEAVEYTVTWDEAEDDGNFGRDTYRRQARRVLSAALAGRTVLELPDRSEVNSNEQHGTWIVDGDLEVSFEAFLHWNDGSPTVEVGHERGGTEEWGTDALRAYCLAGLVACDFADRLATEYVTQKGGDNTADSQAGTR